MVSLVSSIQHFYIGNNISPTQFFRTEEKGDTLQLILWGQHNPDIKSWQDTKTNKQNNRPPFLLSIQFSSVAQLCPTLCDPMNHSTPGLPVHHQLPEFTQTHVHRVGDPIQPSHPLSSPFPPAPNPSQHQSLFQWVNSNCTQKSLTILTNWIKQDIKKMLISRPSGRFFQEGKVGLKFGNQ